jgi:DNA-binding MarR family transcriptional regulator
MPDESTAADRAAQLGQLFVFLGPLYRRVARYVERDVAASGINVGIRSILDMLDRHGPLTVPQMGRAQALSRQFVQRTVNAAAAHGLVAAGPNPAHRRSVLIRLTPRGQEVVADIRARETRALQVLAPELSLDDISACVRALDLLGRAFAYISVDD